jgi:hypothetical protein
MRAEALFRKSVESRLVGLRGLTVDLRIALIDPFGGRKPARVAGLLRRPVRRIRRFVATSPRRAGRR